MSMAEDYDMWMGDEFSDEPKFDDKIWTTKDGKDILICHLEDSHLINIVRMLRRKELVVPYQMELEIAHRKLQEMV